MEAGMLYISDAFVPTSFGYNEEKYYDDSAKRERVKIVTEGEFQRAEARNGNGREYSESLLMRETGKLANFIRERNGLPMELDHPIPDPKNKDVSLVQLQRPTLINGCALCMHLEMHNKIVYGKAEILDDDNGAGAKLASMVRRKFKPAVSSRGVGPEPKRGPNGSLMIPESYSMVTYDFVTNPSTHNAVLNMYMESLMPSYVAGGRKLWAVLADIKEGRLLK